MPRVLTYCPTTAQVAPTNLTMDAGTFRAIHIGGFTFFCPACGDRHPWEQDQAWVEGLAPPDAAPLPVLHEGA